MTSPEHSNDPTDPIDRIDHESIGDAIRLNLFDKSKYVKDTLYEQVLHQEKIDLELVTLLADTSNYISSTYGESEEDEQMIRSYYTAGSCVALTLLDVMAADQSVIAKNLLETSFSPIQALELRNMDPPVLIKTVADKIMETALVTVLELPVAYISLLDDICDSSSLKVHYKNYIKVGFGFTYYLGVKEVREAIFEDTDELSTVDWGRLLNPRDS